MGHSHMPARVSEHQMADPPWNYPRNRVRQRIYALNLPHCFKTVVIRVLVLSVVVHLISECTRHIAVTSGPRS